MSPSRWYCSVDIGGTFTDCVVMDSDGTMYQAKVPTTPGDQSLGFLNAVGEAASSFGADVDTFLASAELVLHGTTVGTNLLVQMNGARTGLITTKGHRDAILIMRSAGRSAGLPIEKLLRVSNHRKPEPIVPPSLIKEVTERVDWEGDVIAPLNEAEASQAIDELLAAGVEAIAICFLWGFVNPIHEARLRDMIQKRDPDMFVSCAHELSPIVGEYERTAAAVINAYIGPETSRYIDRLAKATSDRGYRRPLLVMQSSGGVVPAESASVSPLFLIGSGPVGGLAGSSFLARQVGEQNVIATDVGGTSFDVGVIHRGQPLAASEMVANQYTFAMPRLLLESIGSGGGSIVWSEEFSGTLRVGPESAGADPGPACYARGGTDPTITDAAVVLGFYGDDARISGDLTLRRDLAEGAFRKVAEPLGMSVLEAATGAKEIVEHQMAGLIRQLTVERGLDPRDFVVYAFGGAAGLHAAEYSRELGASEVVVPLGNLASGWSALGILDSDLLHVYEHAELMSVPFDAGKIQSVLDELEARARQELQNEGISEQDILISRSAEMKFSLQIHRIEVEVPMDAITQGVLDDLVDGFIKNYELLYGEGSAFTGAGIQLDLIRVKARGRTDTPKSLTARSPGPAPSPVEKRDVFWSRARESKASISTPVYNGLELNVDGVIEGPAIVEFPSTLVAIPPGDEGHMDRFGSLRLMLR